MVRTPRRAALGATALLLLALPSGDGRAQGLDPEEVLRVALLSDQDPLTVIWVNKPFAAYLEESLGKPVEPIVPEDHDAVIAAMVAGEVEMACFGPASYTIAREQAAAAGSFGVEPFAARLRDGGTTYQSVVIAGADSGFASIADLEGAGVAFGFGDPNSTSSHLAPRHMLLEAGIVAGEDYEPQYLGKHDAVAQAVSAGEIPAGALSRPILERMIRESVYRPERGDPRSDAALRPFRADGFGTMSDGDYEIIRKIRRDLR